MPSVFVVGVGAVGEAIARTLATQGCVVTALMHHRRDDVAQRLAAGGVRVVNGDIGAGVAWAEAGGGADAWILTPRADFAADALMRLAEIAPRLVVFSSNNVAIHPEASTYRALAAAETQLRARFANLAIIRPTMIYGDPRLPTVTRVMRIARAWPLIPAPGNARVQPVFHEDLARLAAGLAASSETGIFAAGGPDIVSMRELFVAARNVCGGRGAVVSVPQVALRTGAFLFAGRGLLSLEQASRVDRDRIAVPQTPLPPALAPRVRLADGLARLWAAMQAQAA